jgi:Beta/Gamma crystallin
MVILSGTWECFDDESFTGTSTGTLGPGTYADVTKHGLKNSSTSSVRRAKPAGGTTRQRMPASIDVNTSGDDAASYDLRAGMPLTS